MLEIDSTKLKWALSTLLQVASSSTKKADAGISLLLRPRVTGGTAAYLATPGWAYSTSVIYDLGEVSPATCDCGDTTVPSASWKLLSSMLRKVKGGGSAQVGVEVVGDSRISTCTLPDGNSLPMRGNSIVFAGLLPENYEPSKAHAVTVKTADLQMALSNALVSAPKVDGCRPALTTVQVTFKPEGMQVYSSDGRRLTRVSRIPVTVPFKFEEASTSMAVRRSLCAWLAGLRGLDKYTVMSPKTTFVGKGGSNLTEYQGFSVGPLCVHYLKPDGHFPNLDRTMPQEDAITGSWTLSRETCLTVLRSVVMTYAATGHDKNDYFPHTVFSYSEEDSSLRVNLCIDAAHIWRIPATQTGSPPPKIAFNIEYWIEWLANQDVEKVVVDLADEYHAARMYPLNDMDNMYVVMPVRIQRS